MKKVRLIIFIVFLAVAGYFIWQIFGNTDIGRLQIFQGEAKITRSGKTMAGTTGLSVRVKDTISTGKDSRVAVVLRDGSVVRLDSETIIDVGKIKFGDKTIEQAKFQLKIGRLWSKVEPLDKGEFEVETPTAVATVRGTSFNTTYNSEFSGIYVSKSKVDGALKSNRGDQKSINEGELLRMADNNLSNDFKTGPQKAPADFIDDWIKFNEAKDNSAETAPARESWQERWQMFTEFYVTSKLFDKKITKLEVRVDKTQLKVNESTNFSLIVTFEDGTSTDLTKKLSSSGLVKLGKLAGYSYGPSDLNKIGRLKGNTFIATAPGKVAFAVSFLGVTSNTITVEVTP